MNEVNLTELNERLGTKQSFLLQEVSKYGGETKFTGAGIIKGSTGKWIGTLDQTDVESIAWIQGDVEGGVIKSYDWRNETITYEVEDEKTQITPGSRKGGFRFMSRLNRKGG